MKDDIEESAGRISGENSNSSQPAGRITGDNAEYYFQDNNESKQIIAAKPLTRSERIAAATREKGLKALPKNFGAADGDWKIIEEENLFAVLYLDYKQVNLIDPEMVKGNFILLEQFWKEQKDYWERGTARAKEDVQNKYSAKNLSTCIKKLELAYEHLSSMQNIGAYYAELKEKRIRTALPKLDPFLKMMTNDGQAEPGEINQILNEEINFDLDREEMAGIIKNTIDTEGYKPYGTPSGQLLSEQLLSVSWMNDAVFIKNRELDEIRKKMGREIFENEFAYSVEEIGTIMFKNEQKTKQYISKGLLSSSIEYFSVPKAEQFIDIVSHQKDEHLRYLQATYRLNPKLPYRFGGEKIANSLPELGEIISLSQENFAAGKVQFKKGYPEVWLMETNKPVHQQLVKIRDRAANSELAFLEFLYTFSPTLPYRFNGIHLVKTPKELCYEIDLNKQSWEAGKKELFDDSIIVWLATTQQTGIVTAWNKVKDQFTQKQDIGLEYFLHLLNDQLEYTSPGINLKSIDYPKIQSGQIVTTEIIFTNHSRGALDAYLQFSKPLPGVYLSSDDILISNASGISKDQVTLSIDSTVLLKGVVYETTLTAVTSEQQKIEIPIAFKIVFPKNAFLLETAKYAVIFSVLFAGVRAILASEYPGWLNSSFNAFVEWGQAIYFPKSLQLFGWAFFILIAAFGAGSYYLTKYLLKK